MRIPKGVSDITGITNAQVKNCRSEQEVLMDYFEWIAIERPTKVVGHNYKSFDGTFLKTKAAKYNLPFREVDIVDTLQLARQLTKQGKLQVENHRQPTIAKFLGIEYRAHSAIEDVKAMIQIYEKLGLNQSKKQKRESLGF